LLETEATASSMLKRWDREISRRIEYFWLCRECASLFTLAFEKGKGIRTVPLPKIPRREVAAPLAMAANAESA